MIPHRNSPHCSLCTRVNCVTEWWCHVRVKGSPPQTIDHTLSQQHAPSTANPNRMLATMSFSSTHPFVDDPVVTYLLYHPHIVIRKDGGCGNTSRVRVCPTSNCIQDKCWCQHQYTPPPSTTAPAAAATTPHHTHTHRAHRCFHWRQSRLLMHCLLFRRLQHTIVHHSSYHRFDPTFGRWVSLMVLIRMRAHVVASENIS